MNKQTCSGCGKDHDPENCTTGFNRQDEIQEDKTSMKEKLEEINRLEKQDREERGCDICEDIFAIWRDDGSYTCFECHYSAMNMSENYPLGGSVEPYDIESEKEICANS